MLSHFVWFLIVVGGALAVSGSAWLARRATPATGSPVSVRSSATTFAIVAIALLILGAVWRVHAIAKADAHVVDRLVHDRGSTLTKIMSVVTTTGDLVPSMAIAGVIALYFYLRTRRFTAWVLPLVVFVEVLLQAGFLDAFHDPTIAHVMPGITVGGSDGIPSGSMARLMAVFLLAAVLWRAHDAKVARRFSELGMAVVFIELVSRLYLARHFLADIAGGLLLGILLTIFFGWLLFLVEQRREPAVQATTPAPTAQRDLSTQQS